MNSVPPVDGVAPELPCVLLVDDRPANLLALEAILEPLPLRTLRADSGEEALRQLLRHEFALVLLDVQMPGLDGFETAKAMRANSRTRDIPIIFVTAINRDAAHVFKGYESGAVDYVLKPFDPDILKAKVAIFVDLFNKSETIKQQAKQLYQREVNALERRNQQRYGRLANLLPLIMWATRADGSIYYVNHAWAEYGEPSTDASGLITNPLVVHPDDAERVAANWSAAITAQTTFEIEYRLRRTRDGMYRWHLARGIPDRDDKGTIEGWVVTATDIDDQRHAQEERERLLLREKAARQTAENANRMKDEFLSNASHELRTPLNAILGWTRMLRSGSIDPTQVARALEVIERNANAQRRLIEDLLDLSRMVSGKLKLDLQFTDAVTIANGAIELVRPIAEAKDVVLEIEKDSAGKDVWVDPDRLRQIVMHLVGNAVKFTPSAGRVRVSVGVHASTLDIVVTDSGVGMSATFLPVVFDRFRQEDTTSTRTHQGLGLGLAMVRHLVELHHGEVRAESPGLGCGSTFTVSIPIAPPADVTTPSGAPVGPLGSLGSAGPSGSVGSVGSVG